MSTEPTSEQTSEQPDTPPSTDRTRMIIVTITVLVGLVVASIPLLTTLMSSDDASSSSSSPAASAPSLSELQSAPSSSDATSAPAAPGSVEVSHRVACPKPTNGATPSPTAELRDVRLPCLTEGDAPSETSMAEQLAGKPSVINVWAWWCGPCREELPIIQQLAQDNPQWNVVGVHFDAKAQAGADLLTTLHVTDLASYQDSNHTFDAATGIPKVVPVTIVYRADGTRAATFAQTFESEAELQQKIQEAL